MNRYFRVGGICLLATLLPACATVVRGTKQDYVIQTDPAGAKVQLSTGQRCVSPCNLRLPRKHDFVVDVALDGYEPAQAQVSSKIRAGGVGAVAGNVLLGGIIGGVVDGSNGSMNDLRPNPLLIKLVPVGAAAAPAEGPAAVPETPPSQSPSAAEAAAAALDAASN